MRPPSLGGGPLELDWDDEANELYWLLLPELTAAARIGGQAALLDLAKRGVPALGVDWTQVNESAAQWAEGYTLGLVRDLRDTTRQQLIDSLATFQRSPGMTREALERMILEGPEGISDLKTAKRTIPAARRAEMIAVTETTRAYSAGEVEALRATGVPMVEPKQMPPAHVNCRCALSPFPRTTGMMSWEWQTLNDSGVCPICGPLNGQDVGGRPKSEPKTGGSTTKATEQAIAEAARKADAEAKKKAEAERLAEAKAAEAKAKTAGPAKPPKFKTTKEAEDWVTKNKLAKIAAFEGLDIRVVQDAVDALAETTAAFPSLKLKISAIGTYDNVEAKEAAIVAAKRQTAIEKTIASYRELLTKQGLSPEQIESWAESTYDRKSTQPLKRVNVDWKHTYAAVYQTDNAFIISDHFGSNYEGFAASIADGVRKGWATPQSTPKSTFFHELAHAIDHVNGVKKLKTIQKLYEEALATGTLPSKYAKTNIEEFIAECWEDYFASSSPLPISKKVGDIIAKSLR